MTMGWPVRGKAAPSAPAFDWSIAKPLVSALTGWKHSETAGWAKPGGSVLVTNGPAIEVRGLKKRFGALEVLQGISLAAFDGDVIAIIGSSGSGKSTLLRCMNLLEVPEHGQIVVAGEEVRLRPARGGGRKPADRQQIDRIRSQIGTVFQSFNLWSHLTVLQNLIEAPIHVQQRPKAEVTAEAEALLAKVGILDKAHQYPAQLSGGQQQRAAIARALAMRPKVMLFDEPTSALDPELVGEVLRVIRAIAQEHRTMLLVTHEIRFAREVASRVVFLHRGQIEEEGPPSQVLHNPRSQRCRQFISSQLQG
ncbi:MAG TPA: ATP-binding cassette domain-containing protein [Hyphomicrobiaceae bacterium]|nr:ATP-binding cassette domain-containing protein [Hyphomicrobiaceae bacterium]